MYFEELTMCAPEWMEYSWSVKVPETCLHQYCSRMPNTRWRADGISALLCACVHVCAHHAHLCSSQGAGSRDRHCKRHASLIPVLFIPPAVRKAKVFVMQKASAIIALNFAQCTKEMALGKNL